MRNLTLLTDLYEITMMQAYFKNNNKNKMAIFDVFYRKILWTVVMLFQPVLNRL